MALGFFARGNRNDWRNGRRYLPPLDPTRRWCCGGQATGPIEMVRGAIVLLFCSGAASHALRGRLRWPRTLGASTFGFGSYFAFPPKLEMVAAASASRAFVLTGEPRELSCRRLPLLRASLLRGIRTNFRLIFQAEPFCKGPPRPTKCPPRPKKGGRAEASSTFLGCW